MKLVDSILIAVGVGFFMIGVNEVINSESESISMKIFESYWAFMIAFGALFFLRYVRQKRKKEDDSDPSENVPSKAKKPVQSNKPKKKKRKKR